MCFWYTTWLLYWYLPKPVDSMLTLYDIVPAKSPMSIYSLLYYVSTLYANLILMFSFAYTYEVIASYLYVYYSIQCHWPTIVWLTCSFLTVYIDIQLHYDLMTDSLVSYDLQQDSLVSYDLQQDSLVCINHA